MAKNQPKKKGWIRSTYDFKKWMGVEGTSDRWQALWSFIKRPFAPRQSTMIETFDEAMRRFSLSDQEVEQKRKRLVGFSLFFFFVGLTILAYSLILAQQHSYFSALASFSITAVLFVYAFQFHFWSFMIKKRKLGCTFKEWYQEILLMKGK